MNSYALQNVTLELNEMTEKQLRFVEEYLVDLDGAAAAVRAGYAKSRARQTAYDLLRQDEVMEAVKAAQKARSERTQVTQDRVLLELARIGFSDVMLHYAVDEFGNLALTADAPEGASAAVASIKRKTRTFTKDGETEVTHEIEYKVWDKNTALANMGKHLGMFVDRVEHTGKDGADLAPLIYLPENGRGNSNG